MSRFVRMLPRAAAAFILIALAVVVQSPVLAGGPYAITIGTTVSANNPVAGAGNLASNSEIDTYTFSATAGQRLLIRSQDSTISFLDMRFKTPSGDLIQTLTIADARDYFYVLTATGTYTLEVESTCCGTNETGNYGFSLINLNPVVYPIAIGSTVSNGVPAAGAGVLVYNDEIDIYTFNAPAGQRLLIRSQDSTINFLDMRLKNPNGELINTYTIADARDYFVELPIGGTHTLEIESPCCGTNETGNYSFQLINLNPVVYPITVGSTVGADSPAAGAGRLVYIQEIDVYTFSVAAPSGVVLTAADTLIDGLEGVLRNPNGETVGTYSLDNNETHQINLALAGTYRLEVQDAFEDESGIYGFTLNPGVPANLLVNGDFEAAALTGSWTAGGTGRVQLKDKPGKAQGGTKFVQMKRGKAKLTQVVTPSVTLTGGTLNLSLYYKVKGGAKGKAKLTVTYTDGSTVKLLPAVKLNLSGSGWQLASGSLPLGSTVQTIQVKIQNSQTGKVLVDTVSLGYTP